MEAVAKDFVLVLQHHPVVFMTLVSLVAFCIMYALAQLSEQDWSPPRGSSGAVMNSSTTTTKTSSRTEVDSGIESGMESGMDSGADTAEESESSDEEEETTSRSRGGARSRKRTTTYKRKSSSSTSSRRTSYSGAGTPARRSARLRSRTSMDASPYLRK